jgi:two-component system sensor histidine kinase KdpD
MLAEGRRRAENGERVVVGWFESHGRLETSRQLGGLEVIAPRMVAYRGALFADFDAAAAIASRADVVLVDELAHTTADRTRQRWQDVADACVPDEFVRWLSWPGIPAPAGARW